MKVPFVIRTQNITSNVICFTNATYHEQCEPRASVGFDVEVLLLGSALTRKRYGLFDAGKTGISLPFRMDAEVFGHVLVTMFVH